jgi:hypothetical protein
MWHITIIYLNQTIKEYRVGKFSPHLKFSEIILKAYGKEFIKKHRSLSNAEIL